MLTCHHWQVGLADLLERERWRRVRRNSLPESTSDSRLGGSSLDVLVAKHLDDGTVRAQLLSCRHLKTALCRYAKPQCYRSTSLHFYIMLFVVPSKRFACFTTERSFG